MTYDGLPLYRYSADGAPGLASGNGVGGVWFAVKPSGNAGASGSSDSGSSSGGGRY